MKRLLVLMLALACFSTRAADFLGGLTTNNTPASTNYLVGVLNAVSNSPNRLWRLSTLRTFFDQFFLGTNELVPTQLSWNGTNLGITNGARLTNAVFFFSSEAGGPPTNQFIFTGIQVGSSISPTFADVSRYGDVLDVFTVRVDTSAGVSNILYFGLNSRFFAMDWKLHGKDDGNPDPRYVWNFMTDDGITQQAGAYLRQYAANSVGFEFYNPDHVGSMYAIRNTNNIMQFGNPTYYQEQFGLTYSNYAPATFTSPLTLDRSGSVLPSLLSFADTNAAAGVKYVGLRSGLVNASNICFVLPTNAPPAGQTNLTVVGQTGTNIFLGWTSDNATGGGATAWDAIGDPSASATINFGTTSQLITASGANSLGSFAISNTTADVVATTILERLWFNDINDSSAVYLYMVSDADGVSPMADYVMSQTAFSVGPNVTTSFNGPVSPLGGMTFNGTAAITHNSPSVFNGAMATTPFTNTTLTVNQATNVHQAYTSNANFTVTFTGTPLDGARGQYDVYNTAASNITVTWPSSYSVPQGQAATLIPCVSNSLTRIYWERVSGTNRVTYEGKEPIQDIGPNVAIGQVLKVHQVFPSLIFTNADDGGAGTTAINDLGDATGVGVVALAGNAQVWTTTLDGGNVLSITNTDADAAADTRLLHLAYNDGADANAIYLQATGDADGTPVVDLLLSQTALETSIGIKSVFRGMVHVPGTNFVNSLVVSNDFSATTFNISTQNVGFVVLTNTANIRTNIGAFDIINTNFVINQRYTNDNRRATAAMSVSLTAAAAGTATVSLIVEHGTTITNKLTVSAGPLASLVTIEPLVMRISPNARYYFTNETSGSGASASLVAGTGSLTSE